MAEKAESKESLRDKLIIAVVQTLIFGAFLAILGFWLNLRMETYKQSLANQSESYKVLLSSLEPDIQQRRAAYLDFQQAAREAKSTLEVYYYRAKGPSEYNVMRNQLQTFENDLGAPQGVSTVDYDYATAKEAASVIRKLVDLREKYEDVLSDKVRLAVDDFTNTIMQDLREAQKDSHANEAFHTAARSRLRETFGKLKNQIAEALGLDQLPVH